MSVSGKPIELWQAGLFWAHYKKYEVTVDNGVETLGGGVLTVNWLRDGPTL